MLKEPIRKYQQMSEINTRRKEKEKEKEKKRMSVNSKDFEERRSTGSFFTESPKEP